MLDSGISHHNVKTLQKQTISMWTYRRALCLQCSNK